MKKIKFTGRAFSGQGEGAKFLKLPWVKRQIEEKLGFAPYNGTLNMMLSEEDIRKRKLLERSASLNVCPAEGYCLGKIFEASVGAVEGAVVLPQVAGYPENVLEIIAPFNLREKLQLADGQEIAVTVTF